MHSSAYIEMAATEQRHWWFVGRRAILESVIKSLALPSNARILEVGSGTGGNLEMLSRHGKVSAVEMDAVARQIAVDRTKGSIEIKQGTFPFDIPFSQEKFDLICLFDVLEHIEEDAATLLALKGLLAKGGRLLITVPAYSWLWSVHDEFLHHKRRYTRKELRSKASATGLYARRLTYFNSILFPLAVSVRLKDKLFSQPSASGTTLPPKVVNSVLAMLFGSERFILNRFGFAFGVSLLAVLEAK